MSSACFAAVRCSGGLELVLLCRCGYFMTSTATFGEGQAAVIIWFFFAVVVISSSNSKIFHAAIKCLSRLHLKLETFGEAFPTNVPLSLFA
jgi:hypothetical protein